MRTKNHKPQGTAPSILQPKILNFDNTGSSGSCIEIGSSTPKHSPTWGTATKAQSHVIQDPEETSITLNNKDPCKFVNNNTFSTNSMDLYASISTIMAKELQQLRCMISSVPG